MPSKHTPGPWEAEHSPSGSWAVRHEWEGTIVYVTDQPVPEMRDAEKLEANARLIAAAPDLLEAAKQFMGVLYGDAMTWADHAKWQDAAESLKDAIRKAEGERGGSDAPRVIDHGSGRYTYEGE